MYSKGFTEKLKERISAFPEGTPFIAKDFADITDAHTVRRLINLMVLRGELDRVLPGVYVRPKRSRLVDKVLPADPHMVAEAIARSNGWIITPSGETALNRIGLSPQVPAAWTYLSDGPYKEYLYNGTRIRFKRTTGKNLKGLSPSSRLVVQGIKALGKRGMTDAAVRHLSGRLSAEEKGKLAEETPMVTEWIRDVIMQVTGRVPE